MYIHTYIHNHIHIYIIIINPISAGNCPFYHFVSYFSPNPKLGGPSFGQLAAILASSTAIP